MVNFVRTVIMANHREEIKKDIESGTTFFPKVYLKDSVVEPATLLKNGDYVCLYKGTHKNVSQADGGNEIFQFETKFQNETYVIDANDVDRITKHIPHNVKGTNCNFNQKSSV